MRRVVALGEHTERAERADPPRVHRITQRLTEAALQQIVADYQSGLPTTLTMRRYGIGKGTVLGVLRRAGAHIRRHGLAPTDTRRAIEQYESGLSLRQVSEHFDCAAETIRTALRQAGVRMRSPNGPRRRA